MDNRIDMLPLRADATTTRLPIVTLLLIAANVFVFAALQPHRELGQEQYFLEHAAIPCEIHQRSPLTEGERATERCGEHFKDPGEEVELFPTKNLPASVLWSMFLQVGIWHVLINMWFLWVFGRSVEGHFGAIWFLFAYLVFGAAADALYYALNATSTIPVVGASGAIAGVLGAYFVLWPRARVISLLGWIILPVATWIWVAVWFGLQFIPSDTGVAYQAHLGGFAAGVAIAWILRMIFGPPRAPVGYGGEVSGPRY